MNSEKVFADGFVARRNDNAPEYVLVNLSVKVDEAVAFLQKHDKKGWVNLQAKRSQGGKLYVELDTWEPNRGEAAEKGMAQARKAAEPEAFEDETLPF